MSPRSESGKHPGHKPITSTAARPTAVPATHETIQPHPIIMDNWRKRRIPLARAIGCFVLSIFVGLLVAGESFRKNYVGADDYVLLTILFCVGFWATMIPAFMLFSTPPSVTDSPTHPMNQPHSISWWNNGLKRLARVKVKAPRSRLLELCRNIWRERLTPTGRFVAAGAIGSIIAGSFPEHTVGSFLFSFFISFIGIALIISLIRTPKVSVNRLLPTRCSVGVPVPMLIILRNTGHSEQADIGAFEYRIPDQLVIEEGPQFVLSLPADTEYALHYTLRCLRRGNYLLPGPSVISAFPFGLSQSKLFFPQPQHLLVHPKFERLSTMNLPSGARYQPNGMALTSRVGESLEFIGTREYQSGDRMRDIHPRSWARVGVPVVRQYQEEYLTRVAMVIDTYVPPLGQRQSFEAALSLGASVADYLARQEFVMDTFAAGPEMYNFQSGRSLAYLDNVLDVLACVEPSIVDPVEELIESMSEELARTSTVIMIFLTWNKARADFVRAVRVAGAEVLPILVVRDSDHRYDADAIGAGVRVVTVSEIEQGVGAI